MGNDDDNDNDDNNAVFDPSEYANLEFHDPTWFDNITEYWTDFVNNLENLSIWHFFEKREGNTYSYQKLKSNTTYILDTATINISFDDIMLLMTIFVLFGENIELVTLGPSADNPIHVAQAVCMFAFVVELILNTWSKSEVKWSIYPNPSFHYHGYLFSFYWLFDILAIVSIWPDIPWIAEPLHISSLATASGGANNYTNAGRVVRLVRLVRFIRLYGIAMERRRNRQQEDYLEELLDTGEIDENEAERLRKLNVQRQSKLGYQLSNVIIQYVIIVIMIMLVVIPILDYTQADTGPDYGISFVQASNIDPILTNVSKQAIVDIFLSSFQQGPAINPKSIIVSLVVQPLYDGYVLRDQHDFDNLRDGTKFTILSSHFDSASSTSYITQGLFDDRQVLVKSAQYGMYLTICVAFVLVMAFVVLSNDVKRLVLKPIERMMNMVDVVAQDPLQPLGDVMYDIAHRGLSKKKVASGQHETQILESSLEKVTGLLRVGFGEAGAGIIRSNLDVTASKSSNGEIINALLPGVRIYAIFGFCDIHHFERINKALGRDVLTFVNTIADIVHSSVHTWSGQCNKNLGNAFVIVWRIGDEQSLANVLQLTASAIRNPSALSPTSTKHTSNINDNQSDTGMSTRGGNKSSRPKSHASSVKSTVTTGSDEDKLQSGPPSAGKRQAKGLNRETSSEVDLQESGSATGREFNRSERRSDGGSEASGRQKDKRLFTVDLRKIPGVDMIADSALISYLKIVAEINRSNSILRYRTEPRLVFSNKKASIVPTTPQPSFLASIKALSHVITEEEQFKVRMGFGLHAGWGIEGAVGSVYKVDATYLSPHVNMAARLETASKQYEVPILMSHIFHELLSEVFQEKCRQIDKVTVKGSDVPIGVFTYDCLQEQEFMKRPKSDYLLYAGLKRRTDRNTVATVPETRTSGQEFGVMDTESSVKVVNEDGDHEHMSSNALDKDFSAEQQGSDKNKHVTSSLSSSLSREHKPTDSPSGSRPSSPLTQLFPLVATIEEGATEADDIPRELPSFPNIANPTSTAAIRNSFRRGSSLTINSSRSLDTPGNGSPRSLTKKAMEADDILTSKHDESGERDTLSQLFPQVLDEKFIAKEGLSATFRPINSSSGKNRRASIIPAGIFQLFGDESSKEPKPMPMEPIPEPEIMEIYPVGASVIAPSILIDDEDSSRSESPGAQDSSISLQLYFLTPEDSVEDILNYDADIVKLRQHISQEFMNTFREGYKQYSQGDWIKAKELLEKCDDMMAIAAPSLEGDGPSRTLLKYMRSLDNTPPKGWRGFRALTNK